MIENWVIIITMWRCALLNRSFKLNEFDTARSEEKNYIIRYRKGELETKSLTFVENLVLMQHVSINHASNIARNDI